MEAPAKGDIVLIPFPFSDLSSVKNRPCLVVAKLKGDDAILCQITSQAREDKDAIAITEKDFQKGKLNITSYARPTKIFTADTSIIISKVGELQDRKIREVENKLCEIFMRQKYPYSPTPEQLHTYRITGFYCIPLGCISFSFSKL